jgi:hypothetical protein
VRRLSSTWGSTGSGLRQPLEALRWIRRTGKLRFTRIGRRVFFRADWLDEAIEENSILRQPRPTK